MKKKNILLLSPFFYPEPISTGKYNTDIVVELVNEGHFVKVLCLHPFYPEWKVKKSENTLDGIEIIRGGSWLRFPRNQTVRRFILELYYAFFILFKIKKHRKDIDIIIPVFPPSLMFYLIIPFIKGDWRKIGVIHDLQEIYSDKKGVLNKIIKSLINKVEKKCYQSCDKLIFLSDEMKDVAISLYNLEEKKCTTQFPFYTIKDTVTNDLTDVFDVNKINIVYSGALGEKQNPQQLYNAFQYCSNHIDNSMFYIFSQGTSYEELKEKNDNENIIFKNLVPRENIEELYANSSIQVIPQKENTSKGSLPSKLPNILASGCKVLVITDINSDIQKLFEEYNFEKVINDWSLDTVLEAFQELLYMDKNQSQEKIAKQIFNINSLVRKIVD